MANPAQLHNKAQWRSQLWAGALLLFAIAALGTSLWPLAHRFTELDENLSHGFILAALFVVFYFNPHGEIRRLAHLSRSLIISGLVLSLVVGVLAALVQIDVVAQLSLIPLLFFALASLSNPAVASRFLGALGLLLFIVPVWEYLIPLLVVMSTLVVEQAVGLLRIPVDMQLNTLSLDKGTIIISDDCSGIRYLVIASCLGYLLCLINRYSLRQMAGVMAVAVMLGLLANWLRIVLIVIVGVQTDLQSPLMADHEYFGWVLFACLLLPALYFAPAIRSPKTAFPIISPNKWQSVITFGLLLTATLLTWTITTAASQISYSPIRDQLPYAFAPINADRAPIEIGSQHPNRQEFARLGDVYAQLDHYQPRTSQDKLVPYLPRRPKAEGWQLIEQTIQNQDISGQWLIWQNIASQEKAVTLRWFGLGNTLTAHRWQAKLHQTHARMAGVNQFTVFNLSMRCATDCDAEQEQLAREYRHLTSLLATP